MPAYYFYKANIHAGFYEYLFCPKPANELAAVPDAARAELTALVKILPKERRYCNIYATK